MKQRTPPSSFTRGVAVLAGGTASGQAILILASPILARLYSPGEFATLALYASVLGVMAVVVGLRYELAIPLPASERDAVHLLFLALMVTALITGAACMLIALAGERATALFDMQQLDGFLWLLPLGIALSGVYQGLTFWAIRKKAFGIMSMTRCQQGIGAVSIQILAGLLHFGTTGLIAGHIAGQAVGFARLARLFSSDRKNMPPEDAPGAGLLRHVRDRSLEYRSFPLYSLPTGFLNTLGMHAPIFIMTIFFKPAMVGMYFLAHRTLMSPIGILTDSVAKVFTSQAAQAFHEGRLGELVSRLQSGLIRLAAGPLLMLIPVAPILFRTVFGQQWMEAGTMAQVLALWLFWLILANPISPVFAIVSRQKLAFRLEVLQSVLRVAALVAGGLSASFYLGLVLFVAASIFTITLKIYFSHAVVGASFHAWTRNLLRELATISCAAGLSMAVFELIGELYGMLAWLAIYITCLCRSARSFRLMRRA